MSLSMKIPELVARLDETVVGNLDVKQSIAVAIRYRYLLSQLKSGSVAPSVTNLLIHGESGSGKTEVIRALAKVIDVPILSYTATSFSETGYKGEDIETIKKDLLSTIDQAISKLKGLKPAPKLDSFSAISKFLSEEAGQKGAHKVSDYKQYLKDNPVPAIVFIDEIDKLISKDKDMVSRLGVQRGLLGIISGEPLDQFGVISTRNILWVAAGAFHETRPGMLLPELLGRLNIGVGTDPVTEAGMYAALSSPKMSPAESWIKMLALDGIEVKLTDDGRRALAEVAGYMNYHMPPSIGYRRLPALCNDIFKHLFVSGKSGDKVVIDKAYVDALDLKKPPF